MGRLSTWARRIVSNEGLILRQKLLIVYLSERAGTADTTPPGVQIYCALYCVTQGGFRELYLRP